MRDSTHAQIGVQALVDRWKLVLSSVAMPHCVFAAGLVSQANIPATGMSTPGIAVIVSASERPARATEV